MGGFSQVTGDPIGTVMNADNMSFDGTARGGVITLNGQMFIGSAVLPHLRVGTLTSPDGSITFGYSSPNITAVVSGSAPYISLSPYVVGSDIHSGYATIALGIAAAVAGGASASNPLNVYIKPGTYTENITLSDGVCLIGFTPGTSNRNVPFYNQCSVLLNGTVTQASGTCSISNISFTKSTGGVYNMAGGSIYMSGCSANHSSNSFWNFTTATAKDVSISNCNFNGTSTATFITNSGASSILFFSNNNSITYVTRSSITANTTFAIQHNKDYFINGYTFDCPFSLGFFSSEVYTPNVGNGTVCTSTANTTAGLLAFESCAITTGLAGTLFDLSLGTAASMLWSMVDCLTGPGASGTWTYVEKAGIQRQPLNYVSLSTTPQVVIGTILSGFRGSQYITSQGAVQTTDATITTIATITIPTGGTTTVKGIIAGQKTDSSDATGGDFLICARNPGGTAILAGTVVTNVAATSTGTFTATVTGATIIIRVTGIAATNYNWLCTYSYHTITTNT